MSKRTRGRLIAGVCIGALTILVAIDFHLANGPVVFCPRDARWIAVASDFPSVYENAARTGLARALNDQAPEYAAAWQAAVRHETGIRPTPLRWRVWLGRRFLGAVSSEGRGACVRPGVLLRMADTVRGLGRWRPAVRRFGPYYYAWRDGALIFSRSEKYVLASLEAEPYQPPAAPRTPGEVWLVETREARSALQLFLDRNIRCAGWIEAGQAQPPPLPPNLDLLPDDAAMAWVAAPDMHSVAALATAAKNMAARHSALINGRWTSLAADLLRKAARPWGLDALEPDWDRQIEGCLLALLDLDTSETLPVPEVGAVFGAKGELPLDSHPLDALTADGPVFPYEWDGQTGAISPRAGEKASLCLARAGSFWLAASQEPAMARLVRAIEKPREPATDQTGRHAIVSVNWQKTAERTEAVARLAAKLEMLPGLNSADFEKTVAPLLRALAGLGTARLYFAPSEDGRRSSEDGRRSSEGGRRLEFNGSLTSSL